MLSLLNSQQMHTIAYIKALIRQDFPALVNYYDVSGLSDERGALKQRNLPTESDGNDHRILSRYDKTQTKYLSPSNSMLHTRMSADHFKVPLTDQNRPDYERLYFAFGARILSSASQSTVGER